MASTADTWPRTAPFLVHKFGGTSVGSVAAIRQVVDIVEGVIGQPPSVGTSPAGTPTAVDALDAAIDTPPSLKKTVSPSESIAVVVSAMGGKPKVTDMLLDLVTLAARGAVDEYSELLNKIEQKHMDTIVVR